MTADAQAATCDNADCRVAETGKCVEGLPLDKCPRYGRQASPTQVAGLAPGKTDALALARGDRLDSADAEGVLRRREARVVAVLGARDAGKTSLIANLYGLFQHETLGSYSFAGCDTLRAFEEACHDARAASNRHEPHFERTPRGALGFYHILLRQDDSHSLDLLLADRAGEEYLEIADDASTARSFSEVVRADVVTLLVDGRRLLDLSARHNLRSELEMMLQALRDGGALSGAQRLAITLTKLDAIEGSGDNARTQADFMRLVDSVTRLFGNLFSHVGTFRVAASPVTEVVPRGFGVSELLAYWMDRPAIQPAVLRSAPASTRSFARLAPGVR